MFLSKSKRTSISIACLAVLMMWAGAISATAQQPACPEFGSYLQLDAERSRLQKSTSDVDSRVKTLKEKIGEIETLEQDLKDTSEKIKLLEDKSRRTSDEENELQDLKDEKLLLEGNVKGVGENKTSAQLKEELKQKEAEKTDLQRQVNCTDDTLRNWLSPEGYFKSWASAVFAGLIGLIIFGFFWIANKDAKVRQAIFSGQVGLQFIALFSIVIAVILFGIIGILEARELSALLGSIAGYILGRAAPDRREDVDFASKVASVEINPKPVTLDAANPTKGLTAELKDSAGNVLKPPAGAAAVQWSSSDSTVASVDAVGVVTRVKAGTANITAEYNNVKSAKCVVTCS